MKAFLGFVTGAVLLTCSPAWGQSWATDMFATKSHNFGTIAAGAKAEYRFVVKNLYVKEVHIASVRASCGCTKVRIENPTLQSYETGAIVASINSQQFRDQRGATLTVVIDRPSYAEVQLRVDVYIRGDVVLTPSSLHFGDVRVGKSAERELTVTRYGNPAWKIRAVTSPNPHLTASAEETQRTGQQVSYRLKVRLDETTPDGPLQEALALTTSDGEQAKLPVMVEGQLLPAISIAPKNLFLGVVAPGEETTKQIVVRGETPFQIVAVSADCDGFTFTVPEKPEAKALHLVPVKFKATGEDRAVKAVIRIQTDQGATLQLTAQAAVKSR